MESHRFDAAVYERRLALAAAAAAGEGLAGLVITPGYDLRYLVGSRAQTLERFTALVLPASGDPTVVVPRLELASLKGSAISELGLAVRDWVDGDNPYDLVGSALGGTPAATAVTDAMPALHLLPLAGVLGVLPVLATDVLRTLRMVKEECEVDALRKAGAAIDRVHARVPEFLVPGRTEADVAADIADAIVAEGHSEVAFIIVGSGPHGADPHHGYSDRELQVGDIVVVDIGGSYEPGYNSDSTRTYSIGEPNPEVAKQYSALQRAQRAAYHAVRPGVTAEQVDAAARDVLAAEGHSEVAFIIVGAGPHGADPHHGYSDRELQVGDIVVVDIGGSYDPGYNSDSTRTYSIGEPNPEVVQQYSVLQRAQRAAYDAVRPGVTAEQVDAAARDVLAAEGLAEYFVHRTGHGIGLSVHEEPYIVAGNDLSLAEGMAFSIEPGIYFPGRWGARIEDIVVVTADGALAVNNRPHELIVVPVP